MPIYQYAPDDGQCDKCGGHFDVMQKMADPALTVCPHCGKAIHREICAPALNQPGISAADIERTGFVQYKRSGKGVYEKTAGKGPSHLFAD